MNKLKRKIKIIKSLPEDINKKKKSFIDYLITLVIIGILVGICTFGYTYLLPYIIKEDIKNVVGKKTYVNDCNTKDYIIIGKDKSYTLQLTNNNCIIKNYEGSIIIKGKNIMFNKYIIGFIDQEHNIIINEKKFKEENNENNK